MQKRAYFTKYRLKSLIGKDLSITSPSPARPERLGSAGMAYNFTVARYALIGSPVSHSLSPLVMERLGLSYNAHEVLPGKVDAFLQNEAPHLDGFNVTSPLKEKIIPFMASLSPEAREIRGVNCAARKGDSWEGHNTDYLGILVAIDYLGLTPEKALVLGTGPGARSAAFALARMGAKSTMVSRKPGSGRLTWNQLGTDPLEGYGLVINATPPGTVSLPARHLGPHNFVLDMNYGERANGIRTAVAGTSAGYSDGLPVLLGQAAGSLEIWLGGDFGDWREKVFSAARELGLL